MAWGIFSSNKPSSQASSDSHADSSSQSLTVDPLSGPAAVPVTFPSSETQFSSNTPPSTPPTRTLQPLSQTPADLDIHPRLNLVFPARLTLFSILSFSSGFLLGTSVGGPTAALRYRAENAHRLPTSTPGWYLYHKSKNYHTIVGGVKTGFVTGLKTTAWGALFLLVEEQFDRWKGEKDFTSTVGAGLTMAGAFSSIYHRGDIFTAARTAKIALLGGTAFGLGQDMLGWARGDTPVYVRRLRRYWNKGENVDAASEIRLLKEGQRI